MGMWRCMLGGSSHHSDIRRPALGWPLALGGFSFTLRLTSEREALFVVFIRWWGNRFPGVGAE